MAPRQGVSDGIPAKSQIPLQSGTCIYKFNIFPLFVICFQPFFGLFFNGTF